MRDSLYDVVAAGHPVAGADRETVQQRLVSRLNLPPQRAAALLAGKPVAVKKAVAEPVAAGYCRQLQALGLATRIVPAAATAAAASAAAASAAEPLTAFRFAFPRVPQPARPARYWLALARCAVYTLAIVAGYFALVAAAIGALLWYAIAFAHLLRLPPLWWHGPLYLLPLLAGAMVLPLLLRPLLVAHRPPPRRPAAPDACRAFAAALCTAFGCAAPGAVELDADGGVTATPAAGRRGCSPRHLRFDLTLGLPLLQNLDLAQLAGQIARALSPLAHPLTRGCLRLNAAVAGRGAACADGGDRLAQWLAAAAERWRQPAAAAALGVAARGLRRSSRWLGRSVVWAERARAHAGRELEADADRWQLAAAGSAAFAPTLIALRKLAAASAEARRHNREEGADAGLVDNLPALIQHYHDHLDAERRRWENDLPRPDQAGRAPMPGLPADGAPAATRLLDDLETRQLQCTEALYRTPPYRFAGPARRPLAAAMFAASEELSRHRLAEVYFNGWFRRDRFWALPDRGLIRAMPVADAAAQLHVCVNEIRRLTPDRQRQLAAAERLQGEIDALLLGQQLAATGQRAGVNDPATALAERRQRLAETTAQLATQEAIMGGRIALALRLAGLEAGDADDLHHALRFLHGEQQRLDRLGAEVRLLDQLRRRLRSPAGPAGRALTRLEQSVADTVTRLSEKLKNVPNPLDTPHLSMGEYVQARLARRPRGEEPARHLLESLYRLHEKLALLIADHGSTAEAAYKTERIKLVDTERS